MRIPILAGLALAAALAACASARPLASSTTVCPEYRDLTCVTAVECTLDAARSCEVCRCGVATRALDKAPPADQREAIPVVPADKPPVAR